MTTPRAARTATGQAARQAGREAGRWIEKLARLGFLAKAAVYGLIGVLALRLAFGLGGGETTDAQGALREIAGAPFGTALLVLVALGLFGYAAWRLVQGALDAEGVGGDGKGLLKRAGYLGSGVLHALLALTALSLVAGGSGGGSGDEQAWTARLMSHGWGVWLVGLAGLIAVGVGLYQLHLAREARFLRRWRSGEMSATERVWGERAGRAGLAARGVVFAVIGWFLLRAAWQADPGEARGLGGALAEIGAAGYGTWLLGLVALGLVGYAVFCVLEARYRRLRVGERRP